MRVVLILIFVFYACVSGVSVCVCVQGMAMAMVKGRRKIGRESLTEEDPWMAVRCTCTKVIEPGGFH